MLSHVFPLVFGEPKLREQPNELTLHSSHFLEGQDAEEVYAITPGSERLCAMCDDADTWMCKQCEQVFYCNTRCQFDDWPAHKMICKDLAKFSPENRPTADHFRAIYFPIREKKPHLIWVQYDRSRGAFIVEHPELDEFAREIFGTETLPLECSYVYMLSESAGLKNKPKSHSITLLALHPEWNVPMAGTVNKSQMAFGENGTIRAWFGPLIQVALTRDDITNIEKKTKEVDKKAEQVDKKAEEIAKNVKEQQEEEKRLDDAQREMVEFYEKDLANKQRERGIEVAETAVDKMTDKVEGTHSVCEYLGEDDDGIHLRVTVTHTKNEARPENGKPGDKLEDSKTPNIKPKNVKATNIKPKDNKAKNVSNEYLEAQVNMGADGSDDGEDIIESIETDDSGTDTPEGSLLDIEVATTIDQLPILDSNPVVVHDVTSRDLRMMIDFFQNSVQNPCVPVLGRGREGAVIIPGVKITDAKDGFNKSMGITRRDTYADVHIPLRCFYGTQSYPSTIPNMLGLRWWVRNGDNCQIPRKWNTADTRYLTTVTTISRSQVYKIIMTDQEELDYSGSMLVMHVKGLPVHKHHVLGFISYLDWVISMRIYPSKGGFENFWENTYLVDLQAGGIGMNDTESPYQFEDRSDPDVLCSDADYIRRKLTEDNTHWDSFLRRNDLVREYENSPFIHRW